ncbi:MAG: phosphate ABC transporter substrate-binding protein PstS, partial [Geminicoccaceae bacterium]
RVGDHAGPAAPAQAQNLRLTGAGASFPFPLYSTWFQAYSQNTPGIQIDYQSTGSGAGVKSLISRTVDFAASDAAMTDEQIGQVDGGVVLLPMTAGEIVLAYNLPGVADLKLPREVYPLIFLGELTSWNDPRIATANPGVKLPDTKITAVRRSDASGTTFVFTNHLAAISEKFKSMVSAGTNPQWPSASNLVAAPRNDGVTATVTQTPGAVGYIEYSFAKLTNTPAALLQNSGGNYVPAGGKGGMNTLAGAEFKSAEDLRGYAPDPKEPEAYPIATFTWMLFYKKQEAAKSEALRNLVQWALTDGQKMAGDLGYIPLPEAVVAKVQAQIKSIGSVSA